MTIYIKVLCSERVPNEGHKCMTNVGIVYFRCKFNYWVHWWLEEIELPSEEILDALDYNGGFKDGAEWILNKLK